MVPWNPEWGQAVRRVEEAAVFLGSVRPVELGEPVGLEVSSQKRVWPVVWVGTEL